MNRGLDFDAGFQASLRDALSSRMDPWAEAHGYRRVVAPRRPTRFLPPNTAKNQRGIAGNTFGLAAVGAFS